MVQVGGYSGEFLGYTWTAARARKPYVCGICGREIKAGKVYFYRREYYGRQAYVGYADYQRVCAKHAPYTSVEDWAGRVIWRRPKSDKSLWMFGKG